MKSGGYFLAHSTRESFPGMHHGAQLRDVIKTMADRPVQLKTKLPGIVAPPMALPAGEKTGDTVIRTETVNVDPQLAIKWLEHNTENRKIDQRRVVRYAEMMRSKMWKLNGEAIIFSKSGRLLNGQHRLWAVVESGEGVDFLVVRGVEDDCFDSLDNPKLRNGATVLALAGKKNTSSLSAALVWKWKYDSGQLGAIVGPSPAEIRRLADENPDYEQAAAYIGSSKKLRKLCAPSVTVFCRAEFSRQSETRADIFFESLDTGTNLSEDSPIYCLRERLVNNSGSISKLPSIHLLALFIKAWNWYCEGRKCRQLKWGVQAGEQFPRF